MVQLEKARAKFAYVCLRNRSFGSPIPRTALSSGPSFPSGHTVNNSIAATYLTSVLPAPRLGWYWFVALAVGYSRIYLGARWPSDVVATLFLGVGEALLLLCFFELIWRFAGAEMGARCVCAPSQFAWRFRW